MYLFIIIIPILLVFHLVFWSFSRFSFLLLSVAVAAACIVDSYLVRARSSAGSDWVCEWLSGSVNASLCVRSQRYILHISIVVFFFAFHQNEKDFQYNISMQHPHMQYQRPKVIVERAVDSIPMDLMNRFVLRKINLSYQRGTAAVAGDDVVHPHPFIYFHSFLFFFSIRSKENELTEFNLIGNENA